MNMVASEVWVPTVVISCPEDYFEQAENSFWMGTDIYQHSVVPDGVLKDMGDTYCHAIMGRTGCVYLFWHVDDEMFERFGRPTDGVIGHLSDGFERVGNIVDAATLKWYESP